MSKYIIQFNEANFDLIKKYTNEHNLPGFKKILNMPSFFETVSEKEYKNLEPWIQWYSFYTELPYDKHKVFHLGDCTKNNHTSFISKIINDNKKVGVFGAMNHKYEENAKIFIPDAWTKTDSDNSFSSRSVSKAISSIVNNNARMKISFKDFIGIFFLMFRPFKLKNIVMSLFSFIKKSRDELAAHFDIFFLNYSFFRSKKSELDFSIIFLNGLAHTQHHYLLSSKYVDGSNPKWYSDSKKDPILECIKIYDRGFQELLKNLNDKDEVWFITGLTQEPFKKPINYWRFKNHKKILAKFLKGKFICNPRMTRDFELIFNNKDVAKKSEEILKDILVEDDENLYNAFEAIVRDENTLFATFSYSGSISNPHLIYGDTKFCLENSIDFIAVKNGGHSDKGWIISNQKVDLPNKHAIPIWDASSKMGLY
tara:strand:- start:2982 stop:4256 length:1275 start_codon:yes stop_codon:yes gene_type:complete